MNVKQYLCQSIKPHGELYHNVNLKHYAKFTPLFRPARQNYPKLACITFLWPPGDGTVG